jgi:hypothetical protein
MCLFFTLHDDFIECCHVVLRAIMVLVFEPVMAFDFVPCCLHWNASGDVPPIPHMAIVVGRVEVGPSLVPAKLPHD